MACASSLASFFSASLLRRLGVLQGLLHRVHLPLVSLHQLVDFFAAGLGLVVRLGGVAVADLLDEPSPAPDSTPGRPPPPC